MSLYLDSLRPRPVPYDKVEHVALTRAFLANPGRFIEKLWRGGPPP